MKEKKIEKIKESIMKYMVPECLRFEFNGMSAYEISGIILREIENCDNEEMAQEAEEREKTEELCLRCEKPVQNGIPFEEGFYCAGCAGYYEAQADAMADNEADRERELAAGLL